MSVNLGHLEAYLGLNVDGLMAGLAGARAAMQKASKQMVSTGKQMTRMISLPLALIGGAAIKMAIDFQKSLRKINTLVGLSSERVNKMAKDVTALSNETARSSVEMADALFVITSAGQRGAEAMQILERSGKAAAIGLGETKDIARSVTSVLNAYGPANISAAEATDQLVSIVREGNLEASELAPTLGRVIGLASTLGISFSEVGASIATFTRLGVDSAEAVTGLRGIMNTLIKPTDQGREALAKMGMTFADLRKQVKDKGLAVTLIDLMEQFKGNEEALAGLVPNVRALGALLGTAGTQADAYAEIAGKVAAANGLVDDGFQAIQQDSGFKFEQTLTKLKNVSIELGATLLPMFNDLLTAVTNGVKWFQALDTSTKSWILGIAGLVAGLGPAIAIIGTLGTVIAAIASPVGLIVGLIAVLGAAILYLADNWQAIKERITDWSWWKNMLISMMQFLIEYNPFSLIQKGVNAIIEFFKGDPIPNPFENIADGLDEMKDKTVTYENEFTSFTETIGKAADWAKGKIGGMWDALVGKPSGGVSITGGPSGAKQKSGVTAPDKMQRYGESGPLTGVMPPEGKLEQVKTNINGVKGAVLELGVAMQNQLNSAFVEFGETLGSIFSGDGGAKNFFQGIIGIIGGFLKALGEAAIAAGVAGVAFQNLQWNPIALIGAGIALVALATVLSSIMKKGIGGGGKGPQGLATGGFVNTGGVFQLHKDELVNLPMGSAVTPANIAQGGQMVQVYGEIVGEGETLRVIVKEAERRNRNIN